MLKTRGERPASGPGRMLAASSISVVVSMLPVFLLGGLAVLIRTDLAFSEARLGVLAPTFFAASAIASVPGGHWGDRIGAGAAMRAGALVSGLAMLGVALFATRWVHLVGLLALAGTANGFSQPATNLAVSRVITPRWQSLALGLKQTAGPTASLLAGVAVPVLGVTLGWRWAFAAAASCAGLVFALVRTRGLEATPQDLAVDRPPMSGAVTLPLMLLAVGVGSAMLGGSSLGAFYVEYAVSRGLPVWQAATWLAVGSLTGILSRVASGWIGGRRDAHHLRLAAAGLAAAALGHAGLAFSTSVPMLLAATLVAFGAGWGYNSFFLYAVVHHHREAPATATGVVNTGAFAGGVIGPVTFGAIVSSTGYPAAWLLTGVAFLGSAVLMLASDRLLSRSPAQRVWT